MRNIITMMFSISSKKKALLQWLSSYLHLSAFILKSFYFFTLWQRSLSLKMHEKPIKGIKSRINKEIVTAKHAARLLKW